jgi:hypothetical protein
MSHVLCPECGNCIGSVRKFVMAAREGLFKSHLEKEKRKVDPSKMQSCPNVLPPIHDILDAAKLTNICCRMHMLGSIG